MSAEQLYLSELKWHKRRPPEINRRPAPLMLARGEGWPHYEVAEYGDYRKIIAPVYSVPTRIRGRVLCAEFDRAPELSDYVLHVGLALDGPASWPLLWRLDRSYITYDGDLRLLVTPGWFMPVSSPVDAGIARLRHGFHESERLHVHLIDAWQRDDERLAHLRRGQMVEVYGPVCALAMANQENEPDMDILFSELERPECWCIYPLRIEPAA